MQIRRVEAKDKEKLVKLLLDFYAHTQNFLSKKQAQFRNYNDHQKVIIEETVENYLSQPDSIVFVADENGSLKGLISEVITDKKDRVYNKEGWVDKWYVQEDSQNKGVGKQLFDSLSQEFKKAGCTHIGLDTHLENKEAIDIYEHIGFTKRLVTFFKPLKDLG